MAGTESTVCRGSVWGTSCRPEASSQHVERDAIANIAAKQTE